MRELPPGCSSKGLAPAWDGDLMTEEESKDTQNEEEDWTSYANVGFGSTDYSLWDEEIDQSKLMPEPDWDNEYQLQINEEEIPSAPSPAGLKHLVKLGACDHCLGRIGGKKRFSQTILESGIEIRNDVTTADSTLNNIREEEPLCPFCENLFEEIPLISELIIESVGDKECSRLQLGSRIPKDQTEVEDHMRKRYGAANSTPLKSALIEEVAKHLKQSGFDVKLVIDKPEILAIIDVLTLTVELDIRSQYFYGRYLKLERGIPQTKWPCKACKGRGCQKCENTGMQYTSSVQGLIGDPLLEKFGSEEHSFHGMGREDIDVRCLGRGRPFVIEFKNPKVRNVDCTEMMDIINENAAGRIEVNSMRLSNRSEVVRVKDTPAEKSYTIKYKIEPLTQNELDELTQILEVPKDNRHRNSRRKKYYSNNGNRDQDLAQEIDYSSMKKTELVALCEEKGLTKSGTKEVLIERLSSAKEPTLPMPDKDFVMDIMQKLQGCTLAQRTPERVAHRRADKIRKRKVLETNNPSIEVVDENLMIGEFSLRCESGTYVKETVHGDGGRTQPSIASLIKAKCTVEWLDVADIHAD